MRVKELEKLLIKDGWISVGQVGSHKKYKKDGKAVIVPVHNGDIPIGTLKAIFKQAGLK